MGVDEALHSLGRWGRWQLTHYFLSCVVFALPATWQLFAIVFIGVPNDHHCLPAPNSTLGQSVPLEEDSQGQIRWSRCLMYSDVNRDNQTVECTRGWQYDPAGFVPHQGTITMEWDLVCSKSVYVENAQTVFVLGVCVGALVFSPLADRWGRRRIVFACQAVLDVLGAAMAFSPNYVTLCVLQFCTGALAQGLYMAGMVLTCEMWPSSMRTVLAPGVYIITSVFTALLAPLAAWTRQWRYLQFIISVIPVVTLIYYKFCPESLLWLVSTGRFKEAERILQVAASCNGVSVSPSVLYTRPQVGGQGTTISHTGDSSHVQKENGDLQIKEVNGSMSLEPGKENKKDTFFELLRRPKPRQYALIMFYLVFVNNLMYFGLTLMSGSLPGNVFVNFAIMSLLDIPGTLLAMALSHCWGRRRPLCFFHIISSVFFLIGAIVIAFPGHNALLTAVFLAAKLGVSAAWAVELVYAQEIFPTNIRSTSLGITSGIGLIGSIFAPYAVYLVRTVPYIPCLTFALLSLVGAVLVLFQIETYNRPLPATIEEVCHMHQSNQYIGQDVANTEIIDDHTMQTEQRGINYTNSSVVSNDLHRLSSSRNRGHQNPAYEVGNSSSWSDAEGHFEIILNPHTLQGLCFETSV